jgi:hypothetical protein
VLALRIPADDRQPVTVVSVALTAVALSEQIGGGLLDDTFHGVVDGESYCILLDEERLTKDLPDNQRAATLAARLGHLERGWLAELRGDVLVTGIDDHEQETHVPARVLMAACRSGLCPVGLGGWV